MMRRKMWSGWMRATAVVAALTTSGTALLEAPVRGNVIHEANERSKPHPVSELAFGKTDKLTATQWKLVDTKRAKEDQASRKKLRLLSKKEMDKARGRGTYRNRLFNGLVPWQRALHDVNLCDGNLFKSYTDVKVSNGRGAGLVLQRTYNSNDERVGPFGVGWTHAYDIRMEEDPANIPSDDSLNFADRTDFFGGKHKYHRDADGLYSPPAYMYDELSSDYDHFLTDGPQNVLADTERSMDGLVKHYVKIGNERLCDSMTDRYGNATLLTYNTVSVGGVDKGLLNTVTDPSGRVLTFHWQDLNFADPVHPAWRITQVDGPQYSVLYNYNTEFNLHAATLDPGSSPHLSRTTQYGYTTYSGANGTENGLLSSVTDPLGRITSYTYFLPNVTGSLWVKTVTEPGSPGNSIVWTLNAGVSFGPIPIGVTMNSNVTLGLNTAVDTQLRKAFHSLGYAYLFQDTYDSANNIIFTHNAPSAFLPGHYISQINDTGEVKTYGPHGNILIEQPKLTPSYDPNLPHTTTTYYNASRYFQKQSVTDLNGHMTTMIVGTNQGEDPIGQLATSNGNKGSILYIRDAGYGVSTSPSYQKQVTCQYNIYGQKVQEASLNGIVTLNFYGDQWGNLTQTIQDPHVAVGDSHLARTTTTAFDIGGHVISATDAMGYTCACTYNSLGQATASSTSATPNTPGESASFNYDNNGRLQNATSNRGTTTFTYEAGNDRLSSVTDPVTGTISYTYGPAGEQATMVLPGGNTWHYSYDTPLNSLLEDDPKSICRMLTRVVDDQGRAVDYWFDESGRPYLVWSNQVFDSNQNLISYMQAAYNYDNIDGTNYAGRLKSLATTWNSKNAQGQWQHSMLGQNQYTFDNMGQRLTNQITVGGNSRTEQYVYDELNRLTHVDYGDGQTQNYTFDSMGNRLTKQDSVTGNESYLYNAANMLLARGTDNYTNDANGNMLAGGGRSNTWDSQNRLVQSTNGTTTNSFVYSGDGVRRQTTRNGITTDFLIDNNISIREADHATGTTLATYLCGARGPEYRRDDITGQLRWYIYDGLGSVLGEVDPNGNTTSSRKYDVYGLVRGGNNPSGTSSHKFVGQFAHMSEDETGLIYMRARYYNPLTGRFLSQDPGYQGDNWYVYCGNNPTNFTDADGKSWADVQKFLAQLYDAICDKQAFSIKSLMGPVAILGILMFFLNKNGHGKSASAIGILIADVVLATTLAAMVILLIDGFVLAPFLGALLVVFGAILGLITAVEGFKSALDDPRQEW